MATKIRRSFTDEFKREAVSLLTSSGRPLTQVARELGIQPSMLRHWRDDQQTNGTVTRTARSPSSDSMPAEHAEIRRVHGDSRGRYGSPRVHAALRAEGRQIGRNRVARLMHHHGVRARQKRRFCRTTDSRHDFPLAPNLLGRRFTASAPDRVWLADITYVPTAVGWAMDERITQELTLNALRMAIATRRPRPGLLHHSDRGSQYAAHAYRRLFAGHGMRCSMSRKADCW